ncbi:SWI/SNF complex subunit SWI3C [Hibiscus syriacus]|uniref:SWI/SNF complex subunit SWI3C n=1 Tax=Hibiscus syriacus TaxID=106335 RepID=A0A6A2YRX6_HIBSY|nr:SWI/SNF complex subunit SWI3C [Hibiscus syriacus]
MYTDGRGRWKRRKRDRRPKHLQEDNDAVLEEDVEEEDKNNDEIDNHRDNNSGEDAAGGFTEPSFAGSGEIDVLADGGVRISEFPAVVKRAVNRPHGSVLAIVAAERAGMVGDSKVHQQGALAVLENVSYGQLQAVSTEAPVVEPEKYVITPPPIMEGRGVIKRFGSRVHVLPMHSGFKSLKGLAVVKCYWFSPATVHRLERQVVPHFFSGKSPEHMPEKYMECRNHIVAKYMDNPEKRITVSDCQGLIDGISREDLTRIVRFLDHWGIINYCAAASCHNPWNAGSYLREEPNGEVHVPSAALKSIDSLIRFDKPKCRLKVADVYSSLPYRDDFSDLDSRIRECIYEKTIALHVDALLCSNCFHDGRFVSGHSSIDFVRVDSTKDYEDLDGDSWTDQETLLLLEAMEIYNENWNEIAEHVGTKSKAQCILHFLRLPMEDVLLEKLEVPSMPKSTIVSNGDTQKLHSNMNGSLPGPSLQDSDSECKLPFANSGNPVMAMVAFLASAVGPRVAAACAHASLAALAEDGHKESFGHGNRLVHNLVIPKNTECYYYERMYMLEKVVFMVPVHKKENSAIQGSFGQNEAEIHPPSAEKVKAASKAGIAAAAMKAKLFADHEEREIQRHGYRSTSSNPTHTSVHPPLPCSVEYWSPEFLSGMLINLVKCFSFMLPSSCRTQNSYSDMVYRSTSSNPTHTSVHPPLPCSVEYWSPEFLSGMLINLLKRLELKLKQFAEVETLLVKECEQVEKTRQRFAAERAHVISSRFGPAGVTSQISLPGVSSPMVNNNINNMQQVMSALPSPPSISGYANNQPVHPQMSFMQRQPMFPMGPRMPLTAMQSSTSAPPNVMFNSSGECSTYP